MGPLFGAGGAAPGNSGHNMDHFCLQIKALPGADIITHLTRFAIEVSEFASRYGAQGQGNSIYITDPQGNTVELRNQI